MSDAPAIVRDFQRARELLAQIADPAATRAAEALDRWLRGEDFEAAAGLSVGWRHQVQLVAIDLALRELMRRNGRRDDLSLARYIVRGIKAAQRVHGARPAGDAGYFWDLLRAGAHFAERTWRHRVAQIRGRIQTGAGHAAVPPSPDGKVESRAVDSHDRARRRSGGDPARVAGRRKAD